VLLTLCSACRVGDPLVDKVPVPPSGGIAVANCARPEEHAEPVDCESGPMLQLSATAALPLRWQTCATMCGTTGAVLEPDDDAGQADLFVEPYACVPTESLDAAPSSTLSCATKRFAIEPQPTTATHAQNTISGARWQDTNIVLEANRPTELIIARSELTNVRLHLVGPVTMRFQDATTLTGVSISGASPDARVAFDDVAPEEITIGDSTLPFAGHIEARHSEFRQASWVIESAELDSAAMVDGFVSVQELVSNDGVLREVTMSLGHALFAPTEMVGVDIQRCASISIFGSKLGGVIIPRCTDEPTRLYASALLGGSLDGVIHGDSSRIEGTRLGRNEPSDFVFWGVHVSSSAFCDEIAGLKVSPNGVQCSSCSEHALEPLDKGCILPDDSFDEVIELEGRRNFCEKLDMLEPCPEPIPPRSRPVVD